MRAASLFVLAGILGCGEVVTGTNSDPICLLPTEPSPSAEIDPEGGPDVEYMAGGELWVLVDHGCIGCKEDLEHECSVDMFVDEVDVESSISYRLPPGQCEGACEQVTSSCKLDGGLPGGVFPVQYGRKTRELVVPSVGPAICISP